MKKLIYILLSLLFTSAYAQDYTDSISISLTDATNFETTTGWYNKPNTTATTTLKDGKTITLAAVCNYDPWTDGSSCYLPTTAFESYHIRWNTTPLTYTITGFSQDTLITIKIMSSVEYSTATTTTASATGSSVFNGNSIDAANNSCNFIIIEDIECNSSGNIVIAVSHSTGDFTAANTIQIFYQGSSLSTFCQTSDLDATASIIPDTVGSGVASINQTVTGGVPPYTYLWTPGDYTTEDLSGLTEGTYSITITDDSLCTASKSYIVTNVDTVSRPYSKFYTSDSIFVNQVAYYDSATKYGLTQYLSFTDWLLVDTITNSITTSGSLSAAQDYEYPNDTLLADDVKIADFSDVTTHSIYWLIITDGTDTLKSQPFAISDTAFREVGKGMIKMFYYNRSTELTAPYAGEYARGAYGNTNAIIHPQAANGVTRFSGDIIHIEPWWFDAGDWNGYSCNYALAMFPMAMAYEMYPTYFDNMTWNIPESSNNIPDILDEFKIGCLFLMSNQDTYDGGQYDKMGKVTFQEYWNGYIMPEDDVADLYVWEKSTGATRIACALLAMGSRLFADIDSDFSDSCLTYAYRAWNWQVNNPSQLFLNSNQTSPSCDIGDYQYDVTDDFQWPAMEMYITTGEQRFYDSAMIGLSSDFFNTPNYNSSWEVFGSMSMFLNGAWQNSDSSTVAGYFKRVPYDMKDYYESNNAGYKTSQGHETNNSFTWGSNGQLGVQDLMLYFTGYLTDSMSYYTDIVQNNLSYILGRNACYGYSFVTGFGSKPVDLPHHRVSIEDGITAPVPGMMVGGPNQYPSDDGQGSPAIDYTGTNIANRWDNNFNSYASNEMAINWQGPTAISMFLVDAYYSSEVEPHPEPSTPTVLTGIVISGSNGKVYSKNGTIKVRE